MKISDSLSGAAAGFAATLPMTAAMLAARRAFPRWEQRRPLPPWRITGRLLDEAGAEPEASAATENALGWLAHLAFGTSAGSVFGALPRDMPVAASPAVRGAVFGLGVWATSYLGWLPALGILRPATRQTSRENLMMIGAHLVWGAALGVVADRLARRAERDAAREPEPAGRTPASAR